MFRCQPYQQPKYINNTCEYQHNQPLHNQFLSKSNHTYSMSMFSYILACLVVVCLNYEHLEIGLNFKFNTRQIAHYKDTIRGCMGFQCFILNFTTHQISYMIENPTAGNRFCNFTDYVMIQRKLNKMWHFQICNMSNTGLTATYSLLKFQDLSTGVKFEGNMSTFGYFESEDFPWYYSRSTKQMIMPWYYLKTIQKLAFNVNGEKIMLQGFKSGGGYKKQKNSSSTTLYRLEGYPDDNSTHSVHSTNLPINVSQACLAANGKYIVMIVTTEPSIAIYNTSSTTMVYWESMIGWEAELIKLNKVNETHVVIAKGGAQPEIRVYDLRVPANIVTIHLNSSAANTVLTPYLHNNTLVYHSTNDSNLHILTNLPIKKQIKIKYISGQQKEPLICNEPMEIMHQKYCVLCGDQCDQCNPLSPTTCLSCNFGFVLTGNGSCTPHSSFIMVLDVLAGLRMSNLVSFDTGAWQMVDDVWLYRFHTLRYENYAKSTLKLIHTINTHRYLPYSLNRFVPHVFNLQLTNSQYSAAPIKYINYIRTNQKQNSFTLWNVSIVGVLLTSCLFLIFYLVWKVLSYFKCSFASFFINSSIFLSLVNLVFGQRVGYAGWLFWSEILDPSYSSFPEKGFMIGLIVGFFMILIYAVAFYSLARWHYRRRKKSLQIMSSVYKNGAQTSRFLTIKNSLVVVESFLHIYLSSNPDLSKILLFISSLLKLMNLMIHYNVYRMVMLYFTSLFYAVSLFLFAGIILLDEFECPELFQVRIKLVQFVALLMLTVFATLKFICYAAIGLKKYLPTKILLILHEKSQNQKKKDIPPLKIIKKESPPTLKLQLTQQNQRKCLKMQKKENIIEDEGTQKSLAQSFLFFMKISKISTSRNPRSIFGKNNKVSPQTEAQL